MKWNPKRVQPAFLPAEWPVIQPLPFASLPFVELTIRCDILGRVEFPRALFQNGRIAYTIRKSQGQAIEENSAFQDAANDMAKLMCKVCSLLPSSPLLSSPLLSPPLLSSPLLSSIRAGHALQTAWRSGTSLVLARSSREMGGIGSPGYLKTWFGALKDACALDSQEQIPTYPEALTIRVGLHSDALGFLFPSFLFLTLTICVGSPSFATTGVCAPAGCFQHFAAPGR
jgi:hypothetical protein